MGEVTCRACAARIDAESALCPRCGTPVEGAPAYDDYDYEAFVSYRHADPDRGVARGVQRLLEGFTVPRALRTPDRPKRLGKVFRDKDELPASDSLGEQIRTALKRSRFLIVICTPNTPGSEWVSQEVELFMSFHGRDKVCAVLAQGEPEESFPKPLLGKLVVASDGTVSTQPCEPLAADVRKHEGGSLRDESLRVVAMMLGCGYDDLKHRRRQRVVRRVAAASATAALVLAGFGGVALYQQGQIDAGRRALLVNESEFLVAESAGNLEAGDRHAAVRSAMAALPVPEDPQARPYLPKAQRALESALQVYPTSHIWVPDYVDGGVYVDGERSSALMCVDAAKGRYAVVRDDFSLDVVDVSSGERTASIDLAKLTGPLPNEAAKHDNGLPSTMLMANGHLVCASARFEEHPYAGCFDTESGELVWSNQRAYTNIALSADGRVFAGLYDEHEPEMYGSVTYVDVIDAGTGELLRVFEFPREYYAPALSYCGICLSDDASMLGVSSAGLVFVSNLVTGQTSVAPAAHENVSSMGFAGDNLIVVSRAGSIAHSIDAEEKDTSIEAFSAQSTEALWRIDARDVVFLSKNQERWVNARVCCTWRDDRDYHVYAFVVVGPTLYMVNARTGEVRFERSFSSTVLDVATDIVAGDSGLFACTVNGEIPQLNSPESPLEGNGFFSSAFREVSFAEFVSGETTERLVTFDPQANRVCVWRFAHAADLDGARLLGRVDLEFADVSIVDGEVSFPLFSSDVTDEVARAAEGLGATFVASLGDGSRAIAQTSLGLIVLLDGETGEVLATSSDTVRAILGGRIAPWDENLLVVNCDSTTVLSGDTDLAVIDLNPESFGVRSYISFAFAISQDGREVLISDKATHKYFTIPYYATDELIERARRELGWPAD